MNFPINTYKKYNNKNLTSRIVHANDRVKHNSSPFFSAQLQKQMRKQIYPESEIQIS